MSGQAPLATARRAWRASAAAASLLALLSSGTALAQAPAAGTAMENLIRTLVAQGTISKAAGDALLAQAQGEAVQSRATTEQAAANAGVPAPPPAPEGTVRVPYVPDIVRRQIADQVRGEVMAQAQREKWAAPDNAAPDWTRRIKISGDMRVRSQTELYSRQNQDDLFNFGAMNATAGGLNLSRGVLNVPILNTTQDRLNRLRIRARLGIDADISSKVQAGIRLATGDDDSPISTNQNLAGGFTKRNVWLDRAYLKLMPVDFVTLELGRFANPFRSTELLFDSDLNFDGVAAEVRADRWLPEGYKLALRGGAFPLDFGSPDFPLTSTTKAQYPDKWLFSGQVEGSYTTRGGIEISGSTAFHIFRNVKGQLSDRCNVEGVNEPTLFDDPTACSTDGTRAFSPRKGNTLFLIRALATTSSGSTNINLIKNYKQFVGLTYGFEVLDMNLSVKVPVDDKINAVINGNYINNLAYNRKDLCRTLFDGTLRGPFNNFAPTNNPNPDACSATNPDRVLGGHIGWAVDFGIGYAKPKHWGEWRLQGGYRYLQSDAMLDSFVDSDFHLGGTNTKGYTIGGIVGLFDGVSLSGRWMSANEISGAPLAIDVLQFDLLAEF